MAFVKRVVLRTLMLSMFLVPSLFFVFPNAIALDNPHNINHSVSCGTCHDSEQASAHPDWWNDQESNVCGQCHSAGIAKEVKTHKNSTRVLAQCTVCHDPHSQMQNRTWKTESFLYTGSSDTSAGSVTGSTLRKTGAGWKENQWVDMLLLPDIRYPGYIYRIAGNTQDAITISTNGGDSINTNCKPGATFGIVYGRLVKNSFNGFNVKFFEDTGPHSFADDDSVIDGVCQVCHTATSHFRNDGSGPDQLHTSQGPGIPGSRCTVCHTHKNSFKQICQDCHGNPPVTADAGGPNGLVKDDSGAGTGSLSPGAHGKHAVTLKYACNTCHGGGMPATEIYDKKIQIGFNIANNTFSTGTYDGRSGLANGYTYSTTSPGTIINQNGSMSCSNIYCHGAGQSDAGGSLGTGNYATPQWTTPSTGACGTCHGVAPGTNPPSSGSHPRHAGAYSYACSTCHYGFSESGPDHVNGKVNISIDPQYGNDAVSSADGQNIQRGFASSTCSQTYCHSNGTSVSTGAVPSNTSANWGSGSLACNSCHGYPPNYTNGTPKANSHPAHSNKTCDKCHSATTADGSTITNKANHVNRQYNLQAGGGESFTYTFNTSGGTCSNVSCHGSGAPQWGKTMCLGCHTVSQGNRAAISPKFTANSHHIQGIAVTDALCYQCHWEANSDGTINPAYHGGSGAPGSPVHLVIYSAGTRPTAYTLGVTAVQYTANGQRAEIAKITSHCLGCHSDQNNATQPFGDGKTPKQYAWDGMSIDSRYSQTGTTTWGKYTSVANAAQKNITKTYSAHGNATVNQEGWNTSTGVDGVISDTTGTTRVQCFDCHNSHGSDLSGITTNYTSSTTNGGILKETTAGKGGYTVTYQPMSGGTTTNKNAYNAGAGLCFDCHMNAAPGTNFPWGYNSTFGSTQRIMGYWDTPYFGAGTFGSQSRYSYKAATGNQGGHFGRSSNLSSPPDSSHQIKGLCTPCHDPHGISPVLGSNMKYAVPLLKGTWLTAPYKEDIAPAQNNFGTGFRGETNYHIDQNTFGSSISNATGTIIAESDSQFAGLCLNCHPKPNLTDGVTHTWKNKNRIHESVKGWKTANGTIQHNYTCSKCHTPHNARLPRLMATNCLNANHKGRVSSNPSPVLSGSGSGGTVCSGSSNCWAECSGNALFCAADYDGSGGSGSGSGRIPGSYSASGKHFYFPGSQIVSCHENNTGSTTDQRWNERTPW